MKFKVILSPVFFAFIYLSVGKAIAQSPNYLWKYSIGGPTTTSKCIVTDVFKNIYIIGDFAGNVDFDRGANTFNLTSVGFLDVFILKLDSLGSFIWVKQLGGSNNDSGLGITVDSSGNIYATGLFKGMCDLNPDTGILNQTSVGTSDIFILKLNNVGDFIWVKTIGDANNEEAYSLTADALGNLYVTGFFAGNLDFDPGPGTNVLSSLGGDGAFILKLDSSGNFVFAKAITGTTNNRIYGITIKVDNFNNIYTTGNFDGTVDADPGPGIYYLTSNAYTDFFISKLDSLGNFIWAKSIGGGNNDSETSFALDALGDIYVTGQYGGSVDFDPGPGIFILTGIGLFDVFIFKLDSSGNFIWANKLGGGLHDYSNSLVLDAKNNIYTTGSFSGTADFDPGINNFNIQTRGFSDVFISKLDSSGAFVWAKAIGGSDNDVPCSMTIDASGHLYLTGQFNSFVIYFDSDSILNSGHPAANSDLFITKLDTGFTTGTNEIQKFNSGIILFPNPTSGHFVIALPQINAKVEITIYDISGKEIYATKVSSSKWIEMNLSDISNGIYFVRIQSDDFFETQKLSIER